MATCPTDGTTLIVIKSIERSVVVTTGKSWWCPTCQMERGETSAPPV